MIRYVFTTLLGLVVAVLVIGLFLPRQILIERERVIDQPREIIFEVLADLRHFAAWSPWFVHTDTMEIRTEGPQSGIGSTLVWSDPRSDRGGRMWIVSLSRLERIDLDLELGDNEAELYFLLAPASESGYRVIWGMRIEVGALDLVGRYTGLLLHRLVGRDHEAGLDNLARYLEGTPGRVPELSAQTLSD